jgi:hypothetical protein
MCDAGIIGTVVPADGDESVIAGSVEINEESTRAELGWDPAKLVAEQQFPVVRFPRA